MVLAGSLKINRTSHFAKMVGQHENVGSKRTSDTITLSKLHSDCNSVVRDSVTSSSKRTSLKWIQPSVDENGLTRTLPATQAKKKKRVRDGDATTDKMRKKAKLQPKRPSTASITVYCDAPSVLSSEKVPRVDESNAACTCCCHPKPKEQGQDTKIVEDEAYSLMVKDEVPENYWEMLAEQRRSALEESLTENKQLHKQVEDLTEENERLSTLASQAEYFASMLNMLTDEKEKCGEEDGKDEIEEVHTEDIAHETVDQKTDIKENETKTFIPKLM